MKTSNLISVYLGLNVLDQIGVSNEASAKSALKISKDEGKTLKQFCDGLSSVNSSLELFDGYYVGYSIKQIGKEFDLLRFCDDAIINIELKGELDEDVKIPKITKQLQQNYYYLKFLEKPLFLYVYVENDGLYRYNIDIEAVETTTFSDLIEVLNSTSCNQNLDPDKMFVPSNYLISPFNQTSRFINSEYFLTPQQQNIKDEFLNSIKQSKREWFCISANAGTGKTLLMYDLVKSLNNDGLKTVVIHCGKLNGGHSKLITKYDWSIRSIRDIFDPSIDHIITEDTDVIFVDEAQRISESQLNIIVKRAISQNIPMVFSYDIKQYLKSGENTDIYEYLKPAYLELNLLRRKLTNKIRTNKEMSSFITNLLQIGKSKDNLNYENITIEYVDDYNSAKRFANHLQTKDWKAITFTGSRFSKEPLDNLSTVCDTKAHDVIGQEFEKVVFFMDGNFKYFEDGTLKVRQNYYSAKGMLYQIVTRVVSKLKIIVIGDPELYYKLLTIKYMGM